MITDELKIVGKCPVTGFSIKTKDSWKYEEDGYSIHPYVISETILIVNSVGKPNINTIRAGFRIFKEIEEFYHNTEQFIFISDQKEVKTIPTKARREYIDFIKNNSRISTVIFYNANKVTKISLKLGKAFMNSKIELLITENYEESILKSFEVLSSNKAKLSLSKLIRKSIAYKKDNIISEVKNKLVNSSTLMKGRKLYSKEELELLNTFLLNIDWDNHVNEFDISEFKDSPFKLIYETIIFIKSELDTLAKERNIQKKELEGLNSSLEKKVEERTIKLKEINRNLQEEILFRKIIEKNLIKSKELAENANKAKSLFLANISHELKTPMNSILGYSSIGIQKIEQIDRAKGKVYFEKINKSGKRLLKLLENLIYSAKSENLDIKQEFRNMNILKVLNFAINEISYRVKDKNISTV